MKKDTFEIRERELDLTNSIKITREVYLILRKQRVIQQKSMARIIHDLVLEKFGQPKNCRTDLSLV